MKLFVPDFYYLKYNSETGQITGVSPTETEEDHILVPTDIGEKFQLGLINIRNYEIKNNVLVAHNNSQLFSKITIKEANDEDPSIRFWGSLSWEILKPIGFDLEIVLCRDSVYFPVGKINLTTELLSSKNQMDIDIDFNKIVVLNEMVSASYEHQ